MPAALCRGAVGTIWCLLVPVAVLGGYLLLVAVFAAWIPNLVVATMVAGGITAALVGTMRLVRPGLLTFSTDSPPVAATPRFWSQAVLVSVLVFLAGQSAALWAYGLVGSAGFDQHQRTEQSSGIGLALLLTLLVAPIAEEALFRGLLYPLLRKHAGAMVAMLLSAALFAAMHGNAVQAIATVPLGLVLALIAERTRRLWSCIALHAGYNFAAALIPPAALQAMATPACIVLFGAAWTVSFVLLAKRALHAGTTVRHVDKGLGSEAAQLENQ